MNKQDLSKLQTCVLRVNVNCNGCKQKVRKLLQKIEGVYSTKIDAETGKVTVIGNVDPTKLVEKLVKAGKHTEIWSFQKGSSNFQGNLNNQFQNMVKIDNSKVGQNKNNNNNNNKARNNGGKEQMGNSYKDLRDMAMAAPPKDKKSVKFNLPEEEFDVSDDEIDDDYEYDDECDDGDDCGSDDDDDHEFHQGNHLPNKMMGIPMMGKHHGAHGPDGIINMHAINENRKRGVGPNKKGGVVDVPIALKGKTGKSESKKKGNNGGKKGRNGGKGGGKGEGDGKKNVGRSGGGFLGFGKKSGGLFGFGGKSCKGGGIDNCARKGGGGKHKSGPRKDGGKKNGPIEFNRPESGFPGKGVSKPSKESGGRNMGNANGHSNGYGPMAHSNGLPIPMGPMGNVNGHMGHIPAVQVVPGQAMMNGGYYQGVGPWNPYNQNQHYMAMMMNQQRAHGNDMYQPMMLGGGPFPPLMPHRSPADNYPHLFSDENANSCSIM